MDEHFKVLHKYKLIGSRLDAEIFDKTLAEIASRSDAQMLPDLFLIFTDRCAHPEVMWGLVHFVESFESSQYIHYLSYSVPLLLLEAKGWTELLFERILRSVEDRLLLKEKLPNLPPQVKSQVLLTIVASFLDDKFRKRARFR